MKKETFDHIDKLLDYHWTMYNAIQIVLDKDDSIDQVDKYIYIQAMHNGAKNIAKLQNKRRKFLNKKI
jgi:hypothetical protein